MVSHFTHDSITYGKKEIAFHLFFQERKTIEVAVLPDRTVTVKVPVGAKSEEIRSKVKRRARWILRQFNYFKQFEPGATPRFYVSGETHMYLGRRYRLKVIEGDLESVKCTRGFFLVTVKVNSPSRIKKIMEEWYREKAKKNFSQSMNTSWELLKSNSEKPNMKVRKMKTRWGSLSKNGNLSLNLELIKAPQECIDYVVIHELCHTVVYHHGAEFYELLREVLPDWERRKSKLETSACSG